MNPTIRAFAIFLLCLLLIIGSPLVSPEPDAYSSSASSYSATLVIYAPPSVVADNHLYPFFIQATDSSGDPLNVNATLFVTTSSFYDTLTQPQAQLIDGQAIVYMNATSPGSVVLSASAQGFQGASLAVSVTAVGAPPYSITLAAPSVGAQGEQVPVIVGAYCNNAPFPDALSSPIYLTSPGNAIEFSFDGQPYSIQYPKAGGDFTVAGNYFNGATISVPVANSSTSSGQLEAAYLPVVNTGRWPVILYATNGSEPVSVNNATVHGTSNYPAKVSVQPTTTAMNGLYSIVYVDVLGEGNATLTFQSNGFGSVQVMLDSVPQPEQQPLMMKAFGPSAGAYANPVKMIQLLSYSGIPVHLAFAQEITVTSSFPSSVVLYFNNEGIAELNLSSPVASSTLFFAQMQDSAPTTFTASLFLKPFTATLSSSNAPVNFTIASGAKVPYNTTMTIGLNSLPNATITLSNGEYVSVKNLSLANGKMIEVTAPSVFTSSITPGAMYVFTGWSDGVVNASRYVASGSDITAEYTAEFLVSVQTPQGQVVSGSGYYRAGSTATLKLSTTSIPTGFLTYMVFVGWQNQATGKISGGSTFTVNGPLSLKAVWTVDYSMLLALLAALMMVVVGSAVLLMWRHSKR